MNDRKVFAVLTTGSHLYGTNHADSDLDVYKVTYPTLSELVSNRHVHTPQCIRDGVDTREVFLGDFVMSLGVDVERSFAALHYPQVFGELTQYWLRSGFLDNLLRASRSMFEGARTDKARAHAYRVWQAYVDMSAGVTELYPMRASERTRFMEIKNGASVDLDRDPGVFIGKVPVGNRNTDAMARWVWNMYKREVV